MPEPGAPDVCQSLFPGYANDCFIIPIAVGLIFYILCMLYLVFLISIFIVSHLESYMYGI